MEHKSLPGKTDLYTNETINQLHKCYHRSIKGILWKEQKMKLQESGKASERKTFELGFQNKDFKDGDERKATEVKG